MIDEQAEIIIKAAQELICYRNALDRLSQKKRDIGGLFAGIYVAENLETITLNYRVCEDGKDKIVSVVLPFALADVIEKVVQEYLDSEIAKIRHDLDAFSITPYREPT